MVQLEVFPFEIKLIFVIQKKVFKWLSLFSISLKAWPTFCIWTDLKVSSFYIKRRKLLIMTEAKLHSATELPLVVEIDSDLFTGVEWLILFFSFLE